MGTCEEHEGSRVKVKRVEDGWGVLDDVGVHRRVGAGTVLVDISWPEGPGEVSGQATVPVLMEKSFLSVQ